MAFLGECWGEDITPTRSLFLSYFHLLKGLGDYFLSSCRGFRVSGAPSNNKGSKSCFFFVSHSQGWGFGLRWSARIINNNCPELSNDECEQLERLKGILATSLAIRDVTEEWLVKVGLSPALQGTARFNPLLLVASASLYVTNSPILGRYNGPQETMRDVSCFYSSPT